MTYPLADPARGLPDWLSDSLYFLPSLPERIDPLALFALLLLLGLFVGEWLQARVGWPKLIGYVLAGSIFGPSLLGWISVDTLHKIQPLADAALGLLMLEVGRRLDPGWLWRSRELLWGTLGDSLLSFLFIFAFAHYGVGLSPAWSAATAAITMASAPAVVLLAVEQFRAQGQVTERIILHTAISCAASFVAFTLVLGVVHAEQNHAWLSVIAHPLWVGGSSLVVAMLAARLALGIARLLPKSSLAQVFVLIACALLAVGVAHMVAAPVYLTLFMMGVALAVNDQRQSLRYAALPEGHWLLSIILFIVVGASLPWSEFTWATAAQALGLLAARAAAKLAAPTLTNLSLPWRKRLLIGIGIQPLSVTAVFMTHELAGLYPESGLSALTLPLFAAAIMELIGPALCWLALRRAGECREN